MRYSLFIAGLFLCGLHLWNGLYSCTTVPDPEQEADEDDDSVITTADTNEPDKPDEYTPIDPEYDIIFNEIEMVIKKLNKIIRNKEYHIWLTYLTEDYKKKKGNSGHLKELSEMPVIKNQHVVLTSLKDYFFYVVVPSRYNVKVDKIDIIDKTHVKVYMCINNEFIILYYLEKQDDRWKIGSW